MGNKKIAVQLHGLSDKTSDIILVVICLVIVLLVAYPLYYVLIASVSNPYDVYAGKVGTSEVDFVAQNSKGITYFQVALSVRDEKTLERELRPLIAIRDHYPKVILTLDEDPETQYDGIRRINARDWMLGLAD